MSRDSRSLPRSRRLHQLLGLGLSGAALAALVYVETVSAHDELDEEAMAELYEEQEALEDPLEAQPLRTAPASVTIPFAAPPLTPPVAMATATETETVAMVVMPDLEGMRLRAARREMKALGLTLTIRDAYGEKVVRELWSDYEVGTQTVEAGTEVEPGSWVRVKAEFRYSKKLAMGY